MCVRACVRACVYIYIYISIFIYIFIAPTNKVLHCGCTATAP